MFKVMNMTSCRVRFGVEIESGMHGVYSDVMEDILRSEGINILKTYYDGSLYGEIDIFDILREFYNLEEWDYCSDSDGMEIVLKSSVSLKNIEENIIKLTKWVRKLGLSPFKAFSPVWGSGGHVHFSSKNIIDSYYTYSEYVRHNELSIKLLALYTAYSLCSEKTYARASDFRYMYSLTQLNDTKFQFIRIVNKDSKKEHIELRVMDSIYDVDKYIDYLKLLRVFVKNSIDKDFNKNVISEILDNSEFNDESELNDYIVYTYNSLISTEREYIIKKESKTLSKLLESFIESMNFKYCNFKNRVLEYIYQNKY